MPDPTVESASHAAVKRLDDLTSRRISASVRITSLGALAARLLSNAVFEGRATRVSIVINLDEWRIECEDNGTGFSDKALQVLSDADQLESLTGLTQHEQEKVLFLRRGTLCSAAALGVLQIWTRTATSSRGLELRAKQDVQILHPPSDATDDVDGPSHSPSSGLTDRAAGVREGFGTKVVVRDLFHCLPVRRDVATSHGPDADAKLILRARLDEVRQALFHAAIPMIGVSIDVHEDSGSAFDVQGRLARKRIARLGPATSMLTRYQELFNVRLGDQDGVFSFSSPVCSGFVAANVESSKARTHLFIRGRPFPHGHTFDEWLADQHHSLDGERRNRRSKSAAEDPARPVAFQDRIRSATAKLLSDAGLLHSSEPVVVEESEGKHRRRWGDKPVARRRHAILTVVNFSPDDDAVLDERYLLRELTRALAQAGIQQAPISSTEPTVEKTPQRSRSAGGEGQGEKHVEDNDAFDLHTARRKRRKVGELVFRAAHQHTKLPATDPRHPVEAEEASDAEAAESAEEPHFRWQDPLTRISYLIDRRTGNSVPEPANRNPQESQDADASSVLRRFRPEPVLLRRRVGRAPPTTDAAPEWLSSALSSWKNPIFGAEVPAAPPSQADEEEQEIENLSQHTPRGSPSKRGWQTRRENAAVLPAVQLASRFFASDEQATSTREQQKGTERLPGGKLAADEQVDGPRKSVAHLPFSAADLGNARIISQLDRKFVLCELPGARAVGEPSRVIACIDQHAADERIRVEAFFKEYYEACGKGSSEAPVPKKPIPLLLSEEQMHNLRKGEVAAAVAEVLRFWGFAWTLSAATSDAEDEEDPPNADQAQITGIPAVVRERLGADSAATTAVFGEVLQLSAAEARATVQWMRRRRRLAATPAEEPVDPKEDQEERQDTGGPEPTAASDSNDDASWLALLRYLPPTLRRLIESKACRGAIMFNDTLTPEQCARLVRDLARTRFPFQCAHGRPCVMPLFEIAGCGSAGAGEQGRGAPGRHDGRRAKSKVQRAERAIDWKAFGATDSK